VAVRIRLKRIGCKNTPHFRVGVFDAKTRRDGPVIEDLGYYDPLRRNNNLVVNWERYAYWLSKGAKPSQNVATLVNRQKRAEKAAKAAPAEEAAKA
jgi:small subunit ribosomal protein S16